MAKTDVRKCQVCQTENNVSKGQDVFDCSHCGSTMKKFDKRSITEVSNVVDEMDKRINTSVLIDFLVLGAQKKAFPELEIQWDFTNTQMKIARCLSKANKHLRDYRKDEELERERLKKMNEEEHAEEFVGAIESIELEADWNAFLTQLKSALDVSVGIFRGGFGVKFHGWHNEMDKKTKRKMSGANILNHFRQFKVCPWV